MASLPDNRALLRGFLALLNGLSLIVLALIGEAYRRDGILPWTSVSEVATTADTVFRDWIATAGISPLEFIGYVGLVVTILGPILFWGAFPLVRWRYGPDIPVIGRASTHTGPSDQYYWPAMWDRDN